MLMEACIKGGVRCCEATVKRIVREVRLQEDESEKHFLDTNEVKGMDHGASRKEKYSKKSKLRYIERSFQGSLIPGHTYPKQSCGKD